MCFLVFVGYPLMSLNPVTSILAAATAETLLQNFCFVSANESIQECCHH